MGTKDFLCLRQGAIQEQTRVIALIALHLLSFMALQQLLRERHLQLALTKTSSSIHEIPTLMGWIDKRKANLL